jgi:hypothetical protein
VADVVAKNLLARGRHGVADALKAQQQDPAAGELSFFGRLAVLIGYEWYWRQRHW